MGDKVGENPAALRAAVFLAIREKPQGGGVFKHPPPPPAGRRLMKQHLAQPKLHTLMPTNLQPSDLPQVREVCHREV